MGLNSTDAAHARGCSKLLARPSQVMDEARYDFCPECKRMVRAER